MTTDQAYSPQDRACDTHLVEIHMMRLSEGAPVSREQVEQYLAAVDRLNADYLGGATVDSVTRAVNPIVRFKTRFEIVGSKNRFEHVVGGGRYYEVIDAGYTSLAGDGDYWRIMPLSRDDDRDAFWQNADALEVIPGAYLDAAGFLRLPTRFATNH